MTVQTKSDVALAAEARKFAVDLKTDQSVAEAFFKNPSAVMLKYGLISEPADLKLKFRRLEYFNIPGSLGKSCGCGCACAFTIEVEFEYETDDTDISFGIGREQPPDIPIPGE